MTEMHSRKVCSWVDCKCSSHRRTLHSFPTRRSSDLAPSGRPVRREQHPSRPRRGPHRRALYRKSPPRGGRVPRSEEHTSELQSRENLVCRLLLEKKKIKKKNVYSRVNTNATMKWRTT